MTVTVNDSRNEYTASAAQTVFNHTFRIYTANDLNVYITPAGQECSDSDLTTDYVVNTATINDPAGGFITLNVGATAGDLVTINSAITQNRTTDYQTNGDFIPETVNADFDRVVSLVKQLETNIGRAPKFSECQQQSSDLSLSQPEALKLIRYNAAADGFDNVNISEIDSSLIVAQDILLQRSSLSAAKADDSLSGNIGGSVSTLGYDSAGDGGAGLYEIVAAGTGTEDGGNFVNSDSAGLFQLRLIATETNVMQWGAVNNGGASDDASIVAAVASITTNQGGEIVFPQSVFKYTTDLQLSQNGIRLRGHCWRRTILWYAGTVDALTINNPACEVDHMHITSLDPATSNHLVGDNAGTGTGTVGIKLKHVDSHIHHCTISYFNDATKFANAIETDGGVCFSNTIDKCYIRYCWGGISLEDTVTDTTVSHCSILDCEKFGISQGYDWSAAAQTSFTGDNVRIWANLINNVNKNKSPGGGVGDGFGITIRRGSTIDIRGNYLEDYDAAVGSTAYGIHLDGITDGSFLLEVEINGNNAISNTVETTFSLFLENCWYGGGRGNHFAGGTGSVTQQASSRWFEFGVNFFTGAPATPYVLNGVHSFAWNPVAATWIGSTGARKELDFAVKFLNRQYGTVITLPDIAVPVVSAGNNFNSDTGTRTYTDFSGGTAGQKITIVSRGAITYDTTGTNLTGSSVDIVTAAGDLTEWYTSDGTVWILRAFVDVSADNSGGA